MKEIFKNILLVLVTCMTFVACDLIFKTPRKPDNGQTYGTSMLISYTMNATAWQIDSICKADTLPEIDSWLVNQFTDYETNEVITKRMYIKERGETEAVYIVTGTSEPYLVVRRITE